MDGMGQWRRMVSGRVTRTFSSDPARNLALFALKGRRSIAGGVSHRRRFPTVVGLLSFFLHEAREAALMKDAHSPE